MMTAFFGIDFGTSNSSISVNKDNKTWLLNVDRGNPIRNSLKSVLYFHREDNKKHAYIGYEAVKQYIETGGEGRYLQSIKTFLPDQSFEKTEIFNKSYKLEELIAFILRTLKERGEEAVGLPIDNVVLGRPVLFSEDVNTDKHAQDRLILAAKEAGFKNIHFQLEPIAAALSYENKLRKNEEKYVLVGDFGGGTSDFTIIKIGKNNINKYDRNEDILSVGGVYIGGDLFDSEIMWEKICNYFGKNVKVKSMMSDYYFGLSSLTLDKLRKWHLIPHLRTPQTMINIKELKLQAKMEDRILIENLENLIEYNYGYLLFQSIEKAKCDLSYNETAKIFFKDYKIQIDELITKQEFENYIVEKVNKIDGSITNLLKDANLTSDDIDIVFLTGGSSYVPLIKTLFENRFTKEKIEQSDAFTSVAYGLGVHSESLR